VTNNLLTPASLATDAAHAAPLLLPGILHLFEAVLILIIGIWISGRVEYWTKHLLARTHRFDEMLQVFFGNLARYAVLTLVGLTVLAQFGVQTTSLVAVIGAASLAIGLALQGTLSNLAAGVMLLIFRPFRLGHHVIVGANDGKVRELTLFWTEIVTDANVQILIPNSSVWGQALKNLSTYPQPAARLAARFPLPAGEDLPALKTRLLPIVTGLDRVAKEPVPDIMFDRATADNTLLLYVKFTSLGDDDEARSAVIEAVEAALHPVQVK
jgi:small conductance mechanosensitive channel